jgi:hypothetical protein
MSYIGSTPTTQSFIAGTDSFNGTGSQTAFTLSRLVNSVNDIQVVVNNVVQYPPNYSVSGNTLTISPAPSSGTNNVYVRYLSTTLQTITPSDLTVSAAKIQTNAVTTDKIADANITAAKLDGAQSGSAPIYGARAWVNFDGTGTVAIRASGNVSSITDNGLGLFTVNFANAMPDVNYSVTGAGMRNINSGGPNQCINLRRSTTYSDGFQLGSVSLSVGNGADGLADPLACCIAVFR